MGGAAGAAALPAGVREALALPAANVTGTISATKDTQYICGTNNLRVVGGLVWSNSLGGGGTVPASSSTGWSFTVTLNSGYNIITVSGIRYSPERRTLAPKP